MQIYRLADGELDEEEESRAPLLITNLKQGAKNPNRVNVFIDGKFCFSLDIAQVVDYKLKVGKEISAVELGELKSASEFGKLYQRTLEWVLVRPRSVRETRDYLVKKLKTSPSDSLLRARRYGAQSLIPLPVGRVQSSEDVFELSEKIIQRLLDKRYLNDRKFAEWYVENRFVKKGVSRKRLRMELMKKGVDKGIIDEVLGGRDDEEEIRKMVARKRAKYTQEKLIAYLCRQGFSYDLVRQVVLEEED